MSAHIGVKLGKRFFYCSLLMNVYMCECENQNHFHTLPPSIWLVPAFYPQPHVGQITRSLLSAGTLRLQPVVLGYKSSCRWMKRTRAVRLLSGHRHSSLGQLRSDEETQQAGYLLKCCYPVKPVAISKLPLQFTEPLQISLLLSEVLGSPQATLSQGLSTDFYKPC